MATADVPSSSSTPNSEKYDVFLSFRGKDTRWGFTSHLYTALLRKHIKTFKDDYDLKRGDEIKPELLEAIERSKISVVIFSKNYASSPWCLAELAHIIKCHKNYRKTVIPVFFDVNPSHIRHQQGSFGDAFVRHEQRFNNDRRVQDWREALCEAANLSGFHSTASEFRDESELVEVIAEDILGKLKDVPLIDDFEGLIGIEGRIEKIKLLLSLDSPNTHMVGIWGIGGLGKTTLAEVVFNKLSDQFKRRCFLADVREESEKNGSSKLLLKLVRVLLEDKNIELETKSLPPFVKERLHRAKVLVVLDDVDDSEQLQVLLGHNRHRFCDGSRIIITTRNKEVLKHVEIDETYEVAKLRDDEAIRLFELTAFGGNSQAPYYDHKLIDEVVKYAGGIPLVIKLLASQLRSIQPEGISWQPILNVLKQNCRGNIEKMLRISYDGLNDEEKAMFLDIACFFKGRDRDFIEGILDGCGSARIRMNNLIDKSLITLKPSHNRFWYGSLLEMGQRIVPPDNSIWMHDLLQEIGQKIVRQESKEKLGKCSRLWIAEDAYRVLNNNLGTEKIEGIFLDLSKIKNDLHLRPGVFHNICNLRLLMIHPCPGRLKLNQDLQFLPHSLRYIYWPMYPSKCLPSNFEPSNLVEVHMPFCKLEQLWDGVQDLDKLKCINLSKSVNLKQIPDLSRAPNLEIIYLQHCTSLVNVPWNTLRSNRLLIDLDLRGCSKITALPLNLNNYKSLSNIPSSIHKLKSLKYLGLARCSFLDECPVLLPCNLEMLDLSWTAIKEIPSSSIEDCPGLQEINLQGCKMIESVPSNIFEFRSLRKLYLGDCSNLKSLPEISKPMKSLEYLGLASTGIRQLPLSIGNLIGIKELDLKNCANLESIPDNIYNLTCLETLELSNYGKLENIPPPIGFCYSGIEYLELSDLNISEIPPGIVELYKLKHLMIGNCKNLRSIPELPLSLNVLNASGCTSLERVSSSKRVLRQLFQARHRFHTNGVTVDYLNFFECLKMDQNSRDEISSDYQLRVLAKAIQHKLYRGFDSTVVCYSGNEIPKWFDYQSEGSSYTIPLTPQWHNANFLGFTFCLVIDEKAYKEFSTCSVGYRNLECKFNFRIRDTEEVNSFKWSFSNLTLQFLAGLDPTFYSDHMFLWYQHQGYNDCHDAVEVSLEFSFVNEIGHHVDSSTKKVKQCGIHMLYQDDLKDLEIDYECDVEISATHEESEPSEDETTHADELRLKKIEHSN